MRIKRHATGGVRKQNGRYYGLWHENGKKKSRVIGMVKDMTRSEARDAVLKIVLEVRKRQELASPQTFGGFVEDVFYPFYRRKWKHSTEAKTVNRINVHLVSAFRERQLASFKRDDLQTFLDKKTGSYSLLTHLRWDLSQIFKMGMAEGLIQSNPALLLFTPKGAKRPTRQVMGIDEIQSAFSLWSCANG